MVVQQSWVYASVVIIGYYTITGLFRYTTMDHIEYRTFRKPEPEYGWEWLLSRSVVTFSTWAFVAVLAYAPSVVSSLPGGAWTLSVVFISVTITVLIRFYKLLASKHGDIPDHQSFAEGAHRQFTYHLEHERRWFVLFFISVPLLVVLCISTLFGIPLLDLAVGLAVVRSVFTARSIRLTLYEDADGWAILTPCVRLWNTAARIPVAVGLAGLIGIGLSETVVNGLWTVFLVPVGVSSLYIGLRYWRLGEMMFYCLPQSVYRPDERNMEDHPTVQRAVYAMLSPELRNEISPRNMRLIRFKALGHELYALNEMLALNEIPMIGGLGVLSLEGYDGRDSYDIRTARLDWAERELNRVREAIEADPEVSLSEPLVEQIEDSEAALGKAREVNEECGREFGDGVINLLYKKSATDVYTKRTDLYGNVWEDE
jgi:hypothetical protein